LGIVMLASGIVAGVYHACKRVLGYSNDRLFGFSFDNREIGSIPLFIQSLGGCFVTHFPWFFWIFIDNFENPSALMRAVMMMAMISSLGIVLGSPVAKRDYDAIPLLGLGILGVEMLLGGMIGSGGIRMETKLLHGFGHDALMSGWSGVIGLVLLPLVLVVLYPFAKMIDRLVSVMMAPVIMLFEARPVLCNHCLRYTKPLRLQSYNAGARLCTHCHQWTEQTYNDPGEVICTFAETPFNAEGRTFVLHNPQGNFDDLGDNLKNALRNTFKWIEVVH
jgi:hypothetical protein